jgi:hypothetical protein
MTTIEAAARVGLAPSTLLGRAKRAGMEMEVTRTGERGRPGYRWTVAQARAIAKYSGARG